MALCQPSGMTLLEYIAKHNETLSAVAERAGLNKGHLWKIAHGERGWNSQTAEKIRQATKGIVTPNDLADARAPKKRRA